MTQHDAGAPISPVILTPEIQQAVWFVGALVRIRTGGDATAGRFALLDHHGERGHGSPVHRHLADEETFFVLDGELVVLDDDGLTVVLVTHEPDIAQYAKRGIQFRDGKIRRDERTENQPRASEVIKHLPSFED